LLCSNNTANNELVTDLWPNVGEFEKFAKKPNEEEDCCVLITIGVGLLLRW
jgi:hypothetical protein